MAASTLATRRVGPWPGPVPYNEEHRDLLKGRELELREVVNRLRAARLVLLTAESGVGKTSFLRAAVVPTLRRRRHVALEAGRPERQPAVLLLRDWVGTGAKDRGGFFSEVVQQGVRDILAVEPLYADEPELRRAIEQDRTALTAVPVQSDTYEYISALAHAAHGLVLVLDQFEEALQGNATYTNEIWSVIARLYRHQPGVKVILSFRQEFLSLVRRLERQLGVEADPSVEYFLPEIPIETLSRALMQSARDCGVTLTPEATERLMRWMRNAERGTTRTIALPPVDDPAAGPELPSTSVNLLKLQALLVELYDVASEQGAGGEIAITSPTLDLLVSREQEASRPLTGPDLVSVALERFVDRRVLPLPPALAGLAGMPAELTDEQLAMLERRRTGARMAEFFSTGTLKVPQKMGPLVARAWRDEWLVLGTTVEAVEDALEGVGEEAIENLGECVGLSAAPVDRDAGILSGIARREGWSACRAADHLLALSHSTLHELETGNIIRPKQSSTGWMYELVHDGFGPAFSDWAEEKRQSPLDMLAGITAQRGLECNWDHLSGVIADVSWRGCWIGPTSPTGMLKLDHVEFTGCDLRGTLFDRCEFDGGAFRNCDLDFVIFLNCTFQGSEEAPFVFDDIRASGLTFHGGVARHVNFRQSRLWKMWWSPLPTERGQSADDLDLEDVQLTDCTIQQWTIDNVKLNGALGFSNCRMGLCDLFGLTDGIDQVEFHDCVLVYCPLNQGLAGAITRGGGNTRYPEQTEAERWTDMITGAEDLLRYKSP